MKLANTEVSDATVCDIDDYESMACYLNGLDEKGELETVLKAIKSQTSDFANCLNTWRNCIAPDLISQKDFDKFWINIYTRYDTCSKQDKKQAGKNCSFEAAMKKPIWNFEHACLSNLRIFLTLFNSIIIRK